MPLSQRAWNIRTRFSTPITASFRKATFLWNRQRSYMVLTYLLWHAIIWSRSCAFSISTWNSIPVLCRIYKQDIILVMARNHLVKVLCLPNIHLELNARAVKNLETRYHTYYGTWSSGQGLMPSLYPHETPCPCCAGSRKDVCETMSMFKVKGCHKSGFHYQKEHNI